MQTDLFDIPSQQHHIRSAQRFSFLENARVTLRLDQALVGLIVLLIFYALIYSWGVDKGRSLEKRDASLNSSYTLDTAAEKPASAAKEVIPAAADNNIQNHTVPQLSPSLGSSSQGADQPKTIIIEDQRIENAVERKAGKFTIQLATYTSQSKVDAQLNKLSQKGYSGFVIPSGKYLQVCIDRFESKSSAKQMLKQIKNAGLAPADAYVRSVPSSFV